MKPKNWLHCEQRSWTLSNASAHVDIDGTQHRLEYEEKNLRNPNYFYRCFRHRKVRCQELKDLQQKQHEGRVWVRERFALWAKVALETRRQRRRTTIITAVNEELLQHV